MKNDESAFVPFEPSALPCERGPWLVLAPHADDESFGMGGTLALATRAGIAVHLLVLTDGAQGGSSPNLIAEREAEARAAAAVLGLASVTFFRAADRALAVHPVLVQRLLALVAERGPRTLFFPGICELHPDHRATALLAWQALQAPQCRDIGACAYEITMQSPLNLLVDITAAMEDKRRAMACYRSQLNAKNYPEIVEAFNRVRSLSLAPEVQWAEAFYRFSTEERRLSLLEWARLRLQLQLDEGGSAP